MPITLTGKSRTSKLGYQIHETTHGKLIIFPGIKRTPEELIKFINQNAKNKNIRVNTSKKDKMVLKQPRGIKVAKEAIILQKLRKALEKIPEYKLQAEQPLAIHVSTLPINLELERRENYLITKYSSGKIVYQTPTDASELWKRFKNELKKHGLIPYDFQYLYERKKKRGAIGTVIDVADWKLVKKERR